jgi:hypothetical protein
VVRIEVSHSWRPDPGRSRRQLTKTGIAVAIAACLIHLGAVGLLWYLVIRQRSGFDSQRNRTDTQDAARLAKFLEDSAPRPPTAPETRTVEVAAVKEEPAAGKTPVATGKPIEATKPKDQPNAPTQDGRHVAIGEPSAATKRPEKPEAPPGTAGHVAIDDPSREPILLNPGDMPRKALQEFRKEVPGISASSDALRVAPTVTGSPSYWECRDGETILTVDLRGNASYRKAVGWSMNPSTGTRASGRSAHGALDEAELIRRTQQLATSCLSTDRVRSLKPAVKRETLLLARIPRGRITEMPGRAIVRLLGQDDDTGFFQAVFDPTGTPLRVDLALGDARTRDFCNLELLGRLSAGGNRGEGKPLALGCFFDPGEYRFEISAYAVEGEPFVRLDQTANPFGRDNFDLKDPHRVSIARYRDSQDYHWWCWAWWQRYGRVGAFRGSWLERGGRAGWEYPRHQVLHHRSLASYRLVGAPPRQTNVLQQTDGPVEYPFATGRTLEPAFYRDLEQCHVAFLFTHGGPIEGVYQVRRGPDVWVMLMPPGRRLGIGNLRHLFLDGCAAFTYRREPQSAHLVETWIRRAPARGLRTACGVDGVSSGLDRGGWRFFGYYNKGESISDSWAFASLDEYIENCPATAAYGKTIGQALESLLTGRFSDQEVEAMAVAISVWAGSPVP